MAHRTRKPMYRRGTYGSFTTGDTASHEGDFTGIRIHEAAVFQSLTGPQITGDTGDSWGDITFPALDDIDGAITEFRLASGSVTAYFGIQSRDPA